MADRWHGMAAGVIGTAVALACLGAGGASAAGPQVSSVQVLHSFAGADGALPLGQKIAIDPAGQIFGETYQGGAHGLGTVFKLTPPPVGGTAWTLTTLHDFAGGSGDGANGRYDVVRASNGYLYGCTDGGGTHGQGVIYRITPGGSYSVIHSFGGPSDGGPAYSIAVDDAGDVFGVARFPNRVFKLLPNGVMTIRYLIGTHEYADMPSFITRAADGTLYGATWTGQLKSEATNDDGVIFKIAPGQDEVPLGDFLNSNGYPNSLTPDGKGNLYGTTVGASGGDFGEIFRWSPAGGIKILHVYNDAGGFVGGGGLVLGADGNFYGAAVQGGNESHTAPFGWGTLYRLTPGGTFTRLYAFTGGADGGNPGSTLVRDAAGWIYGTASTGGAHGKGTIFRFHP